MKYLLYLILLLCNGILCSQESETVKDDSSDSKEVSFAVIENVPIYKGCDPQLSNSELKKCMSSSINSLIARNFNYNLANSLGLPEGLERISVIFKVNKDGEVKNIKAKASHTNLEQEAIRVINLIPIFDRPGLQRGEPVTVQYAIPIMIRIEAEKKKKKKKKLF